MGGLAVLERVTTRSRQAWTSIAALVLVLSFGGPLSASGITAANKAWLTAIARSKHAVAAPTSTSPRGDDVVDLVKELTLDEVVACRPASRSGFR